jgi:hypothetical protein
MPALTSFNQYAVHAGKHLIQTDAQQKHCHNCKNMLCVPAAC